MPIMPIRSIHRFPVAISSPLIRGSSVAIGVGRACVEVRVEVEQTKRLVLLGVVVCIIVPLGHRFETLFIFHSILYQRPDPGLKSEFGRLSLREEMHY